MFEEKFVEREIGGKLIRMSTGKMARQADGAVLVQCEGTVVLVTAVGADEPREGQSFFPLTVDVEEKMYAAGKIPGGFIKREGRPSENSILTARLIDRPIRPCFPDGFFNEIQIIATIMSVDQINPFDVFALLGASAALSISNIPFDGPVAAVRVGRVDGQWIANPNFSEIEMGGFDMLIAGNRDSIVMVEGETEQATEEEVLECFEFARKYITELIELQDELHKIAGREKYEPVLITVDAEIEQEVRKFATDKMASALVETDKLTREANVKAVKEQTVAALAECFEEREADIGKVLYKIEKEIVRSNIISRALRPDGRKPDEVRPINVEVGIFPRTHGTGLFTRGQTQVLSTLTLGAVGENQMLDGLGVEDSKRYIHHYNFPPFCVGETGFMRGPKRRDIGHGALAERALLKVVPSEVEFPYTIRIVSEVLESNGSSSMASVCGSTLALMDAGVPISAPVAGVAMGLICEGDDYQILTDIQGIEDFLGDMDFKVAGTRTGITAMQMDIKGQVNMEILKDALMRAKTGRLHILDKMLSVIPEPRPELSEYAPRVFTMIIDKDKIREVIGPQGKIIREIIAQTDTIIDIEDDGTVFITAKDMAGGEKAREMIEQIVKEVEVGERYLGTVVKTTTFGAFVELLPGKDGLVHISRLAGRRIEKVEDVVRVGDKILVDVIEIDDQGRVNLAAVLSEGEQRQGHSGDRPHGDRRPPRNR